MPFWDPKIGPLFGCLFGLAGWLLAWLAGWLAAWLAGCWISCLAGWLLVSLSGLLQNTSGMTNVRDAPPPPPIPPSTDPRLHYLPQIRPKRYFMVARYPPKCKTMPPNKKQIGSKLHMLGTIVAFQVLYCPKPTIVFCFPSVRVVP